MNLCKSSGVANRFPLFKILAVIVGLLVTTFARADVSGPITVSAAILGESEAISWSFNTGRATQFPSGGTPRDAANLEFEPLVIKRFTDEHTPAYLQAVMNGTALPEIVISRGSLSIILTDAVVINYSVDSSAMIEARHRYRRSRAPQTEEVSIIFRVVEYEIDGRSASWDIQAGETS